MSTYIFTELNESQSFDPGVIYSEVSFTQQSFYGNWQKQVGRTVKRFTVSRDEKVVAYFQLIVYPLLGNKNYIYIPYGPVTSDSSEGFFGALKGELLKISKKYDAVFARLDFTPIISSDLLQKIFTKASLSTYHSAYFQPRFEWYLNLSKTEEELLMGMHEKTRYSVRLAERKDIKVEIVTENFDQYLEPFYMLMKETAERNSFGLHEKEYYASVFKSLAQTTDSYLSIAKYGDKILAIDLVIISGKVATYVFGGSTAEERNRMPTYLAQWKAICHAKSLGCTEYNFGGISDDRGVYKGWEGITIYKKKFGGHEVRHSDFYDVVASPFWYYLYVVRKMIKKYIK